MMTEILFILGMLVLGSTVWLGLQVVFHWRLESKAQYESARDGLLVVLIGFPAFVTVVQGIRCLAAWRFERSAVISPLFVGWVIYLSMVGLRLAMKMKGVRME